MKNSTQKPLQGANLILKKGEQELELGLADISAQRIRFNKNFVMIWPEKWQKTGCIMLDLVMWLLCNMNKGWIHRVTDELLAEKLECTRKTIGKAKKTLHDANILKYEAKGILLNPEIFYRGGSPEQKRQLEQEYKKFRGIGDERSTDRGANTLVTTEPTETLP